MSKLEANMDILEEGKENSERWLLTYSDMITLLLALFIILYSMSALDAEKFKELSKNMNAALNNPQSAQTEGGAGSGSGIVVENSLEKIAKELNAYVKSNHLDNELEITQTSDYVKITIKDSALFVADRAQLLPKSIPIIDKVAKVLNSVYPGIDHITISGHTADIGKETINAWTLSSDRAIAVLTRFVSAGLPQDKLSIEGNSHYKPVAPNDSPTNMAKNRRVEITVTKNAANGGLIKVE